MAGRSGTTPLRRATAVALSACDDFPSDSTRSLDHLTIASVAYRPFESVAEISPGGIALGAALRSPSVNVQRLLKYMAEL